MLPVQRHRDNDMNSKIKITVLFIILLTITLGTYYRFRWPYVEKNYVESMAAKASSLKPVALKIKNGASDETLKKIFNELVNNDSSLAAIAVTGPGGFIKQMAKNDSMINSGASLDMLIREIKNSAEKENVQPSNDIQKYHGNSGRFYIFSLNTENSRFIAVYIFRPGIALLIRIILELLLVVLGCFVITAAAAAAINKKSGKEKKVPGIQKVTVPLKKETADAPGKSPSYAGKGKATEQEAVNIDESELFNSKYTKMAPLSAEAAVMDNAGISAVSDALNNRVFDLFKKIYRELSPRTVSLYIKRTEKRLSKSYALKGRTFLRVDAPVFESIPIAEMTEVKRPGAHITDNGMKVRIPLFDNESLIGLVEIDLKESVTALDIGKIQHEVKETSRQIKEFIVINNVIIDSETGYYSSSYLSMKLGEQVYSAVKHHTVFCLLVADIFGDREIDRDQKNTMMKILLPSFKKITGDRFELFNRNYMLAVIMEGTERDEAEKIRKSLEKEIARYRIKLPGDKILRLTPSAAFTFSDEAESLKDIMEETARKTRKVTATT